ncbi:MAG: hypothetical protein EOT05_04055 [Candidatus Microsaccharimonas sossegonensis]|uniref:Uncharacterized protein n=1 Tax=Candidatus Microsaccharimonas sossegonensis TaxID=2506948 RepID=A0A4Q0AI67_9BACT|nr:MAG: hypothetical protein EOT05_04055 [Candidatus Microsaccharimonas sossegonensis]
MIIFIHVSIALLSIAISSFTFFKPTMRRLFVSYGFILGTIATGTYLLMAYPSRILQSCIMGLIYLTIVTVATVYAHRRLHTRQLAFNTERQLS